MNDYLVSVVKKRHRVGRGPGSGHGKTCKRGQKGQNSRFVGRKSLKLKKKAPRQEKINIAIDGPAASGKTTVGKELARRLNYQFLDSGLLYRHFAYFWQEFWEKSGRDQDYKSRINEEEINELSRSKNLKFVSHWKFGLTIGSLSRTAKNYSPLSTKSDSGRRRELSERDERDKNQEIKKKATELLEKELEIFVGKLERIRSNQISLETIRGLTISYQGEKKPLKTISSLRVSPSNELIIRVFEPQLTSLIVEPVRKMGYKLEGITKNEAYFTLLSSGESREKLIRDVKSITEEGKVAFRQVRQALREKIWGLSPRQK
ncbi:7951_t:CDS:2 [Cetraspora pellucida]|uniref:(d)CMP kinase n=1 Tax=Cetraspora pellucida TaxID=1433469 RepID=A0A9N9JYR7_9GLOM|nr:7951_t:CDS:2 [Cetraspora pellucida]